MNSPVLAVGIDPAKRVHRAVAVLYPDTVVLDVEFPNQIEACRELDRSLTALARQHGAELVYGIEDHRRYGRTVAQVLSGLNRQIRVVNPLWTSRQRAFYGQDKDDSIDGRCIAAVVLRRADALPDASEESELASGIREAERRIQDLAQKRTKDLNRLHQQLTDTYTACYENFFGRLRSPLALKFFRSFPLPQDLNGLDSSQMADLMFDLANGVLGPRKGDKRQQFLREKATFILEATKAAREQSVTPALALKAELIRQFCDELLANIEQTLRLQRILRNQLLPASGETVSTIPGIGTILASAIIGEIGDIKRFPSKDAFAKYNGTAPASNSSGGKQRHTARRSCNHRLKRAFWLAGRAAVVNDPLARAYYDRCRQRGLTFTDAVKRVARRMSDMVYAMLKTGVAYDRDRVMKAIEDRARHQVSRASGSPNHPPNGIRIPKPSRPSTARS
jgi:transposase